MLETRSDLTKEKVRTCYLAVRSVRQTALRLHLGCGTVRALVKEMGLSRSPGGAYRKGRYFPDEHVSPVAAWIRKHGWVKLPRSVKQLAFYAGVSYETARCYVYRRRKEAKKRWTAIVSTWNRELNETVSFELVSMDLFTLAGRVRATSKTEVNVVNETTLGLEEAEELTERMLK